MKTINQYIQEKLKKINSKSKPDLYDEIYIDNDMNLDELRDLIINEICIDLCDNKQNKFYSIIYNHDELKELLEQKFRLTYNAYHMSKADSQGYYNYSNDIFELNIFPKYVHPEKHNRYYINNIEVFWVVF